MKKNKILKEKRCFLLIIPFSTIEEIKIKLPDAVYFARNILEIDDDYYDKILFDYKVWREKYGKSTN